MRVNEIWHQTPQIGDIAVAISSFQLSYMVEDKHIRKGIKPGMPILVTEDVLSFLFEREKYMQKFIFVKDVHKLRIFTSLVDVEELGGDEVVWVLLEETRNENTVTGRLIFSDASYVATHHLNELYTLTISDMTEWQVRELIDAQAKKYNEMNGTTVPKEQQSQA